MSLLFIYLFIAVGVSFLCSILEAVLLSTSVYYIDSLLDQKKKGALVLKKTKSDINNSISAILTLNTFAHTLGAAGVGAQAMMLFGEEYMFVISAILTLIILYVSEIIPKTVGALYWKKLAIPSAYIINIIVIITYPLLKISSIITNLFEGDKQEKVSIGEIKAITTQGEKDGIINEREGGLIDNVLDLKQSKVKDILTPRSVVFAQPSNRTVEEFCSLDNYETFSRVPVYNKDLDDILGMVLLRTVMSEKIKGNGSKTLESFMTPLFTINENIPVSRALEEFIRRKEHIFLVQDNYLQTEGIITLEDAIETLLGVEIMDEFDSIEDMQLLAKLKMHQKHRK